MADRGRRAAARAETAAAELEVFLQRRASASHATAAGLDSRLFLAEVGHDAGATAQPARAGQDAPVQPLHTDWLFHHLTVTGSTAMLQAFRGAAAGAGTIPWAVDFDEAEEDWFHRVAAARELSLAGARILARQLRDAAEHRHSLAVTRVGHNRACPFDLHALVPVPPSVLQHGPDHPDSLAWLWQHWGTTEALRHVVAEGGTGPRRSDEACFRVSFWSADWSPWRALEQLRRDWQELRFELQPHYDLV